MNQPSMNTNNESCSQSFLFPTNENEVNESLEFLHYELELQSMDRDDLETGKTHIISLSVRYIVSSVYFSESICQAPQ